MKLYHFTYGWLLEHKGTILSEGLKPLVGVRDDTQPPFGVVWLSTLEEETWRNGASCCRITIDIPPNDRRLVRYADWLREHDPQLLTAFNIGAVDTGSVGDGWKSFYVYFGTISPKKFRCVELTVIDDPTLDSELPRLPAGGKP